MSNKILLDYFFPITAIEPTPAASTGFLKQVAAVVKKKSGGTAPAYHAITSSSQIATYTDNVDVAQLFAAGMNKVHLFVMDDLDLADMMETYKGEFYTLLISSDFNKAEKDAADYGEFDGVVGWASATEADAAEFAAEANHVGFLGHATNKSKSMFYAFGKLLSNALGWKNQQYITMPFDDGVDNLGDAETMFDDKVSFVMSDDEFGKRLALFAVGGKAIVAPYIKKNLMIDLQSTALTYVSGNQPAYTKVQAALLEDELMKKIQTAYIDTKLIESATVEVTLVQDNFVANGNINIAEPKALWRIFGEMQQTL